MFEDLFVVETASVLAGPSVGMFFAELGATVVKIESPAGDVTRRWKLETEDSSSPISAYFCSVNYGKEHRLLDLKTDEGKLELHALVAKADVLISNHLERQSEALGLSKSVLKKLNPTLVHGHIKGFAHSDEPAYDVVLQAETGYISMTGTGDALAKLPIAMIDILAGHQLKEGILVALMNRAATGKGAYVEVSLEQAALAGLANQASNYLMEGAVARPMGTLHPNIVPYGNVFTCLGGSRMLVACGSEGHFERLLEVLDLILLKQDERFQSNQKRLAHRDELHALLAVEISLHERDELLTKLEDARVPAGAVRSVNQFLDDPVAQEMVLESEIDGKPTKRIRGNAFTIAYS